jgi:uncharacterized protein with HEPN domain
VFLADVMVQDAILMRLQVIGEHLAGMRRIDGDRFAEIADETWYQLIGLRNVTSHGYETINFERIWEMTSGELSELKMSLAALDDK